MNSRINIRIAGTVAANINQTGRACDMPTGLINQPLSCGAVGDTPSGTSSFYIKTKKHQQTHFTAFSNTTQVKLIIVDIQPATGIYRCSMVTTSNIILAEICR